MSRRTLPARTLLAAALLAAVSPARSQSTNAVDCLGCVDRGDIATGAVTAPKLGLGAVTTQKIKNGAVTLEKLAPEVQARLMPLSAAGAYEATTVAVDCAGGGTPLTDALAALNPAAAVYDVQIRGTCNENLELFNFQSLTLRSADPASPATIGRVLVQSGSSYVELSSIRLQTLGQGTRTSLGTPVLANYGTGRLQLQGVEFVCVPPDGSSSCEDVVVVNSGDGRLNGMTFSGAWTQDSAGRKGAVAVNRGGNAVIQPSGTPCLDLRSIATTNMATAQVADGAGCEGGLLRALSGGTLVYSGGTVDVEARQGTVLGNSGAGNGQWFRTLSCDGVLAAVVDQFGGNTNYCAP